MPCYSMAANGSKCLVRTVARRLFFFDIVVTKHNLLFDPATPVKFAAMRIRGNKYMLYIRYLRRRRD